MNRCKLSEKCSQVSVLMELMEFVYRQLTYLSLYVHCSNQQNIIDRKKIYISLSNDQCNDVDNNDFIAGIFLLLSITKREKKNTKMFIEVVFNLISEPILSRRWICIRFQ